MSFWLDDNEIHDEVSSPVRILREGETIALEPSGDRQYLPRFERFTIEDIYAITPEGRHHEGGNMES